MNSELKRIHLILNPNAGSAEQMTTLREAIDGHPEITAREGASPEESREIVRRALDDGYECIAAVGGDGTVNVVVNALMQAEAGGDTVLGVVPLGTGNDLARTLALPPDPREAMAMLLAGQTVRLDLMEVQSGAETAYGINAAAGGFSGQVDEAITTGIKKTWGPLAYLLGAARVLPDLQDFETTLSYDDAPEETMRALNVIVANGRTAAGGHRVAPAANPCDGLLDVVVVRWGSATELAEVGARLVGGNYLESNHVVHRRTRRVRIAGTPPMWFNVDGELFTKEPVTFTARPGALRVVVGPDFQADLAEG